MPRAIRCGEAHAVDTTVILIERGTTLCRKWSIKHFYEEAEFGGGFHCCSHIIVDSNDGDCKFSHGPVSFCAKARS